MEHIAKGGGSAILERWAEASENWTEGMGFSITEAWLLWVWHDGFAQVAQSVEQRTENPCVGGSIPPLGTILSPYTREALFCSVDELRCIAIMASFLR